MAVFVPRYPYYLRVMRVAVSGISDTELPPSVQSTLYFDEKTVQEITGLSADLKNVVFRADLALKSYGFLRKAVTSLSLKLDMPKLQSAVQVRLDRIFSGYTPHTKAVHVLLDPMIGALTKSSNQWYDDYNRLTRELNTLSRTPVARRTNKPRRAEIAKELGELRVDDKELLSAVKRLPKVLDRVFKEFDALEKLAESSDNESPLLLEIKKRRKEAEVNRKGLKKLKELLGKAPGKLARKKEKEKYLERYSKYEKYKSLLEFNDNYVHILEKAREDKELTLGITTQTEKAKKDIEELIDRLGTIRPHRPIPEAANEPEVSVQPPPVSTENDNKKTISPGRARKPPKRFPRPRMSSTRERLSKVAKRLLIIDYLRHKSL